MSSQTETDVHALGRMLSASGIGLWDWDFRTGQAHWSDGHWTLYGLAAPPPEVTSTTWTEAIHPDDRERVAAEVSEAIAGGVAREIEYRIVDPEGRVRWLVSRGAPVRGPAGEVTGYRGVVLDVTALKQADLRAIEGERAGALQQAIAHLPVGVVLVEVPPGEAPRFLSCNQAYARIVGGSPVPGSSLPAAYRLFQPDRITEIPPRAWPGPRAANGGETVVAEELHLLRADGSWRIVSASAAPFVAPSRGDARQALVAIVDLTDHVLAADAARAAQESEARFRTLVEEAADAFFLHDREGRIRAVNRRACKSLGYSREELLRMKVADVEADFDSLGVDAVWERTGPGQAAALAGRHRRRDGTVFPVEVRVACLELAGERLFMALARDVSVQRTAEEALRESEARFRDVVASADEYVFEMDAAGRVTYISEAAEAILGYRPEEIIGRSSLDLLDPEEKARSSAFLQATVAGRARISHFSQVARHRSGRRVWLDLSAVPVIGRDGSLVGYRGTAMDVTWRHEADEERARLQARLAQAHRMEVVGRLAGGVAHDFNNLLTVILACGFDLRDRLRAGEPGDAEAVEDILGAGQRAAELTRQLLAFARKQVLSPTRLDVNEILRQSRKLLSRVIGEDVRIVEDVQDGPWTVRADSGLLSQVVMNLAVNARDAMPRGGTLSMSTANVELRPGEAPPDPEMAPGRYVRLRVSDTGVGMAPEVLEHVFEPFFTTKAPGSGIGLGLATAYGNVKQSGGHVVVESRIGAGSTFDVYLPALAVGEVPEPPRAVSAAGGSERVLVVEDDAKVREIVERSLRAAGYRVVTASSGEEALRRVHADGHPIDLLVTDVVMPGMGGPEVARRVLERVPRARVLFVSGYTDDAIGRHGVLEDGVHFLPKPFTSDSLLAGVRAVLDAEAGPLARG